MAAKLKVTVKGAPVLGVRHDLSCGCKDVMVAKSAADVQFPMTCPVCGAEEVSQDYGQKRYWIDPYAEGCGYGAYCPTYNQVIESYGHKQQLMREHGHMDAGDPVHGSRELDFPEGYRGPGDCTPSKPSKADQEGWELGRALATGTNYGVVQAAAEKAAASHKPEQGQ